MALIIKDRVKEITTTTGTGAVSLGGASATFDAFQSVMSNGDTTFYAIVHTASATDEWEVGLGTWNTGNTLTRTTVYAGSSGTSAVNFSSGNKDVFMTYPAGKAAVKGEDVTFADITVTGTVDGRDLSVDGAKLDNIEANATADQTAAEIEAIVNHDNLQGFVSNEHIDWTASGAGTIHATNIPTVALTTVQTAANQTAHLALTAQEGDIVVRSDENKSYVHNGGTAGTMADYTLLLTPTDAVLSVNGQTGAVTISNATTSSAGLMSSTDKSKLDGVESGATADQTASEILTAIKTVDGSGSGLNADLLDGQHASAFAQSWRALNNTGNSAGYVKIASLTNLNLSSRFLIQLAGTANSYGDGKHSAYGVIVGQLNNDNNADLTYYNHAHNNTAAGEVALAVYHVDVSSTAIDVYVQVSTYAELTAIGSISDGTLTPASSFSTSTPSGLVTADEHKVWNSANDGSGSGLDADLLDGQHASAFLTAHPAVSAASSSDNSGRTYIQDITLDTYGHVTGIATATETVTNTDTTNFNIQANSGTQVNISAGEEINFINGDATTAVVTNQTNPTVTFNHNDTSSQASVNNSNGTVIQDVTLDGYGHVTGLASVDLDGRYYTESEINTFINRSYVSSHSATNLAVGWYTIAQNTGDRAVARFALWDTQSSKHQSVIFYAAHHYGTDSSNTLTVLDNSYFSGNPFRYIRIKDGGTYDGAAVQVYIDDPSNAVNIALVGDDVQSSGWEIVDFLADASAPSLVSNWTSFTEVAKVDLNQIAQGGFATTGPIYADGDTTQYRVFNDNYHPNADTWTTGRTIALTGDVTGTSGAFNGSANLSFATNIAANVVGANELNVSGNGTTSQFLRSDGDGTFTWATPPDTNTNQLTTFQVEDGDGTEVTISHAKEWKFVEGAGDGASIDINWTDTTTGSDADPYDLTFAVTNTDKGSSQNIFKTFTVTDTDSGYTWAETGSVVADTNSDTVTFVSGNAIDIDVDATNDAIRISTTDSPTFATSLTVDGHTLQDSADRSGLLALTTSLGTWRGIQIQPTTTSKWSIMGDQDDFGLYDDENSEWILQYNENSTLHLNANGVNSVTVTTSGLELTAGKKITFEGATNDGYEIILEAADATADRIITLPDKMGTVALDDVATTSADGLMSASDKSKLNGIDASADVNQSAFSYVAVSGQNTVAAGNPTTTLTLAAGSNVTITTNATTDTVTVAATDTNTTSLPIENSGGTAQFTATDATGLQFAAGGSASVAFDATNRRVTYSSTDTNTTYSAGSGINLSGTTFSHSDTSSQASVNNSGNTFIQDITVDTYGHITALTSATATASANNDIFWENGQSVSSNYTITNGKNAMSAGPISINSGVTVTVGSGETWTVV